MFCPFCGSHFSQLARFCFSCGKSLEFLKELKEGDAQAASKPPNVTESKWIVAIASYLRQKCLLFLKCNALS